MNLCAVKVLSGSDSSDGSSNSSSSGESPNVVYVSLLENLLTNVRVSKDNDSHVPVGDVIFTRDYKEWHHRKHITSYDEHIKSCHVPLSSNWQFGSYRSQMNIRECNQCLEISHRAVLCGKGANFFWLMRNIFTHALSDGSISFLPVDDGHSWRLGLIFREEVLLCNVRTMIL